VEGNCIIGQSGGPTVAINASVLGLVQEAFNSPDIKKVYGVKYGIEGVLRGDIFNLLLKVR